MAGRMDGFLVDRCLAMAEFGRRGGATTDPKPVGLRGSGSLFCPFQSRRSRLAGCSPPVPAALSKSAGELLRPVVGMAALRHVSSVLGTNLPSQVWADWRNWSWGK